MRRVSRSVLIGVVCGLTAWGAGFGQETQTTEDFQAWLATLRDEALGRKISQETLDAALDPVELLDRVVEPDRNQPEFTMTFERYRDRSVTDERVKTGRDLLRRNSSLLA